MFKSYKTVILFFCLSSWTLNGIPLSAVADNPAETTAGIFASFVVHWLSHVVFMEAANVRWEQKGLREVVYEEENDRRKWARRSGFIGQLLGGIAIKMSSWGSSNFATGYHIGTAAEITTYPLFWGWENSDLEGMKKPEFGAYAVGSIYLLNIEGRKL